MNYLVVICGNTFGMLMRHLQSTVKVTDIKVAGRQVQRCERQVQDWFVIVYPEPQEPDNLVSDYLKVIIEDILNHSQQEKVQVDQVRVYFHFSNIFPNHDAQCRCGAGTIQQTRYQDYEEKLKKATNARGEIQVWGFHRTGEIWKVLNKLPEWLSGGGTLFSNPRPRSFSEFIKELDKASHEEIVRFASILKHRIAHLFTPIDIDLQGLMASNFRPDYWEKVVAAYRGTTATMVIEEARKMKEELHVVANDRQKEIIDGMWAQAEEELQRMEPLLRALREGELDECKREAGNFRKSLGNFLRILDELDDELRALDERRK